ncbi:S1C family serine protease [Nocardia sp. alder85J]|uniref:S1C family serine protease n=1 Tax=Nocardia sp. alder85J TaxID=2862949 RepID=UPI001CD33999|nr:trypsin-like peptidase domain-containing protein [Nocardia sp. alder85J]MCX4098832.1 trypsin-like peptidase domain-containing protein [Nocardia sp. alder85J]
MYQPRYDERRFTGESARVGRSRFARTSVVLLVVVLALAAFLGYRDELPSWVGQSRGASAALYGPPMPPMDADAVAHSVEPELVNIDVLLRPSGVAAAGTGIVLTADGQVLTSHHVVKGADTITVGDLGTGAAFPATVVGYDSDADIALLSLTGAHGLPVARIGSSGVLRLGDDLVAIGNAGGTGTPTAFFGPVTALDAAIVARNAADMSRKALTGLIEVSAPVMAGQSGGALVDRYGAVVGVVTAASGELSRASGQASGYAVPIDTAMGVIRQIRTGVPTDAIHVGPTATLGVVTSDGPSGARVDVSLYGQPAFAAGVAEGEVITGIDGRAVGSAQSLRAALNTHRPADAVHVDLTEPDGSRRTVVVVLASGPPN